MLICLCCNISEFYAQTLQGSELLCCWQAISLSSESFAFFWLISLFQICEVYWHCRGSNKFFRTIAVIFPLLWRCPGYADTLRVDIIPGLFFIFHLINYWTDVSDSAVIKILRHAHPWSHLHNWIVEWSNKADLSNYKIVLIQVIATT